MFQIQMLHISKFKVHGMVGKYPLNHPNSDYEQPGNLYRLMKPDEKDRLINNIVADLKQAKPSIQERQVRLFYRCDPDYGMRVAKALGLDIDLSKAAKNVDVQAELSNKHLVIA